MKLEGSAFRNVSGCGPQWRERAVRSLESIPSYRGQRQEENREN